MADSEIINLYLDDVGEEIEVQASVLGGEESCTLTVKSKDTTRKRKQSEGQVGTRKKKRKMLTKQEKARVMLHLCDIDIRDLIAHIKATVEAENHLKVRSWNFGNVWNSRRH